MAGSTANFGIGLISGGSDDPSPDEVADAKQINDGFKLVDGFLGVKICTSGTRPATPKTQQLIVETDTGKAFYWNGSTWVQVSDITGFTSKFAGGDLAVPLTTPFQNETHTLTTYLRSNVVSLRGRVSRPSGGSLVVGVVAAAHRPPVAVVFRLGSVGSGNVVGAEFFVSIGTDGTINLVLLGGTFNSGTFISFNVTWTL